MWREIVKSFASSLPVAPFIRWGDKSFCLISLIEIKRDEIVLTIPDEMNVNVGEVLRIGRPFGSGRTRSEFRDRILVMTGKVQVTKIFPDSRVQVILLRGKVIDAICVEKVE
jgi:hypothetical protein